MRHTQAHWHTPLTAHGPLPWRWRRSSSWGNRRHCRRSRSRSQSWARAAATPTHHLATLERRRRRRRQIASQPLFSYAKALTMIVINWEADSARRTLHTLQAPLQHCRTLPPHVVARCTVQRRNGRCWRCSMSSVAIGRCFGFAFSTFCRGVYSLSTPVWWHREKIIEEQIID